MKLDNGFLCTMCSHGINLKETYICRVCGKTCCPHVCLHKDDKRNATCHRCELEIREEKRK